MAAQFQIEAKKVVELLTELEYLVTSLDRIGSAALSRKARMVELERFFVEGEVFSRLALARRTLAEAVDEGLSLEERESIEEKLEQIKPWVLTQR
jgi:hypothetical protein